MDGFPESWTHREVRGVTRRLPMSVYPRVLDICCGVGRHAARLAAEGYRVTGIDRDEEALVQARAAAPDARFLRLDQRDLFQVEGPFDAAIILWQSFGYFDAETNDRVLHTVAGLLRPGGRLLLDLYHPGYFHGGHDAAATSRSAGRAAIANTIVGDRLLSRIEYPDGANDTMDFELFQPHALAERAALCGFDTIEQCCWWEDGRLPDPAVPRYQSVLERR